MILKLIPMMHMLCTCMCAISIYVTQHAKTRLMYTKYISSYYNTYLLYCLRYQRSAINCIRLTMKCCINGMNFIRILLLFTELFKFYDHPFSLACAYCAPCPSDGEASPGFRFKSKSVVKFSVHTSPIFSCQVTLYKFTM